MMPRTTYRAALALPLALALGCAAGGTPAAPSAAEEPKVRAAFADLQAALKADDADKVWALLTADSRADAERAAKNLQEAYGKSSAEEKADQEKTLALSGSELAGLTGSGFLKSTRFRGKYDEVPEAKVEKVTVQGDRATVNYVEPDGDKEKLDAVREGGQWKFKLPMPRTAPQ